MAGVAGRERIATRGHSVRVSNRAIWPMDDGLAATAASQYLLGTCLSISLSVEVRTRTLSSSIGSM